MSEQATARPWRLVDDSIVDESNTVISISGIAQPHGYVPKSDQSYANAELIVRAVNAHNALVAALKPLCDLAFFIMISVDMPPDRKAAFEKSVADARDALKLAGAAE